MFSFSSFEKSVACAVGLGLKRPARELEVLRSSVRYFFTSNSEEQSSDTSKHKQCQGLHRQTRGLRSTGCPRVSAEDSTLLKPQNFGGVDFALKDKAAQDAGNDRSLKTIYDLDGPKGWPILGNFLMYLRKENKGRMHEVQAELHQKYGKIFREKWGPSWQCHVSDPKLIEEIYRHEGKYPNRPSFQAWVLDRHLRGLPCGLTTAQSKEWQLYRTEFGKRLFCPNAVKSLVVPFNEVADDLIKKLAEENERNADTLGSRLPNTFYLFSLEAAGSFLFETRLGCLSESIPERTQKFIDSILEMMSSSLYLIVGETFHQRLNTRFWKKHQQSWDRIFKIGKQLIDEKVKAIEADEAREGPYLSHLLKNENLEMDQIYSNITELLMASSDTTANTLGFVLYLLANNPEKQEILRNELNQVVPEAGKGGFVSREHIDDLKYLKGVIKETMRMYPVVTMNCRILEEDLTLDGFKIPKKTLFVINHYAASMDPDQFNEPEKFHPERWLRGDRRTEGAQRINPFASLPFGFGGRSCLGKHVANQELMITLTKILKNFEVLPVAGEKLTPVLRTLLTPGLKLPIKLRKLN